MSKDLGEILRISDAQKPYILVGHSLAGITLPTFIAQNREDVAGVILVDVSHPEQFNRLPEMFNQSLPRWLMLLLNELGLLRPSSATPTIGGTNLADRINTVGFALRHKTLSARIEEEDNLIQIAGEASKFYSFGDIPLVVISSAAPDRYDGLPEELKIRVTVVSEELQQDLLTLSTDSKQIFATESGHYVHLDQPEVVIDAIREMISKLELISP